MLEPPWGRRRTNVKQVDVAGAGHAEDAGLLGVDEVGGDRQQALVGGDGDAVGAGALRQIELLLWVGGVWVGKGSLIL